MGSPALRGPRKYDVFLKYTPVMSTVTPHRTHSVAGNRLVWPSPQVRSHGPQEVQGDMRQSTSICWMEGWQLALFLWIIRQWYILDCRGHLDFMFQFHVGGTKAVSGTNRYVKYLVLNSKLWSGITKPLRALFRHSVEVCLPFTSIYKFPRSSWNRIYL